MVNFPVHTTCTADVQCIDHIKEQLLHIPVYGLSLFNTQNRLLLYYIILHGPYRFEQREILAKSSRIS